MMRDRIILITATVLSLGGYVWLGYFTQRTNFIQVFSLYFVLFGLYGLMLRRKSFIDNFKIVLGIALLFRLILLFMTPNLSDDYFRFMWDGLFVANGSNPYTVIPSVYLQGAQYVPGISMSLYEGLNSPDYYSVYPAFCQLIFGLSARICGSNIFWNVVFIRISVILAEFGSMVVLYRISRFLNTTAGLMLIYVFNPLVIFELAGNLHPEAFMIFFLLLAIYLLMENKQIFSALSFGVAVDAKLIPLVFLPLLIKRLGLVKSLRYFAVAGCCVVLLFAPFINIQAMSNVVSSLSLYFRVFEFNASIYYIARWIGYQIAGYNTIAVTALILAAFSFLTIVIISYREKWMTWRSLFSGMTFCLTAYLLFATTIHPWYLTPLITFSAFTRYRFAVIWSFLVVLSYSAYRILPYSENLWLVAVEYVLLAIWAIYEIFVQRDSVPTLRHSS